MPNHLPNCSSNPNLCPREPQKLPLKCPNHKYGTTSRDSNGNFKELPLMRVHLGVKFGIPALPPLPTPRYFNPSGKHFAPKSCTFVKNYGHAHL
jgi:hypothetical protein